ncbi:Repressor of protein 1 isoform 1 [Dorcoceras hygrometricum]|uniref:Repressor of protein 1 isoform 1 n=1 Tax=Dorcoceras hygrometricum TaxID=472368 RepID=A0A2Z7A7L8_9LAMI|nr:Repressor of protein 1 isoform 1 [Dorcoceras hygrometricum]
MAGRTEDTTPHLINIHNGSWIPSTPAKLHLPTQQLICDNWQENHFCQENRLITERLTQANQVNQPNCSQTGRLLGDYLQEMQCQLVPACSKSGGTNFNVGGGFEALQADEAANSHVHGDNSCSFTTWQAGEDTISRPCMDDNSGFFNFCQSHNAVNSHFYEEDICKYGGISVKDAGKWITPIGNLLAPANVVDTIVADNAVSRNDFMAIRSLSAPRLNPQIEDKYSKMRAGSVGDLDSLLGDKFMDESNHMPDTLKGGTSSPSWILFDLNSSPIMIKDTAFINSKSGQFEPITPEKTNKVECIHESVALDSNIDEVPVEKDSQENKVYRDEVRHLRKRKNSKLDVDWFCTTTSTELPENDKPDKVGKKEANFTKTPQQRPRRRKHRPKVVIEGQAKRPLFTITWKRMSQIDSVIEKLKQLNLNAASLTSAEKEKALVVHNVQHEENYALVPYQSGGAVVPFDNLFDQAKRRQHRPKVDLDDETSRVWKLLLEDINSNGIDGNDEENRKWWEEERRVFNGRADSFIARMHLIQGDRRFSPWKGSVVDSVIGVFLTQNVSDHLSSSAFMSLAAHFPFKSKSNLGELHDQIAQAGVKIGEEIKNRGDTVDWDAVRCADANEIAKIIKDRGMNNMLAQRMKDFLNRLVKDHGSTDLEWLRNVPPDKAKEYLLSIQGLGLKSVECVRLLTLHQLAFPVDTNVGRISVRLGWVPLQPLPESLQLHLLELYPVLESIQKYLWPRLCKLDQRTLYELHYQMITFGKVFCTKNKPNCNACPMRGECRHFASAFASARLGLPAPEEKSIVNAAENKAADYMSTGRPNNLLLPSPQVNQIDAKLDVSNTQPIIEEPATPEPIIEVPVTPEPGHVQVMEFDIENPFHEDLGEIPTIQLNMEEFNYNLQKIMQQNSELQEEDMSKALVALSSQDASIPFPRLKNVSQLRTEHQVYELPDSHPLLEGMDKREQDDPSPYLLAIWTPGETQESIEPPKRRCSSRDSKKLCTEETCSSCNSIREADSQTVRGTLLIPCRTAMRGSFPLNGTYFQVNEPQSNGCSKRVVMEHAEEDRVLRDFNTHKFLKGLSVLGDLTGEQELPAHLLPDCIFQPASWSEGKERWMRTKHRLDCDNNGRIVFTAGTITSKWLANWFNGAAAE